MKKSFFFLILCFASMAYSQQDSFSQEVSSDEFDSFVESFPETPVGWGTPEAYPFLFQTAGKEKNAQIMGTACKEENRDKIVKVHRVHCKDGKGIDCQALAALISKTDDLKVLEDLFFDTVKDSSGDFGLKPSWWGEPQKQ